MSAEISEISRKYAGRRGRLIAVLQEIQDQYNYLPTRALKDLSEESGVSLVDIYGVATFYKSFSLTPKGKHLVSVCMGTACHVRGAPGIAEELERQLGIKAGQTTTNKEFTLETVNCLGACAIGPIVVVDGHYFSKVSAARVKRILNQARAGMHEDRTEGDWRIFPVRVSCPRCNHSLMDPDNKIDGHPSVRMTITFGGKHGWVRLSSLYGSYAVKSKYPIPMDSVVNLFCPHCHAELVGASRCPACNASMVPMLVDGGGMVQICTRRGCKEHRLDLNGVNL
jgi:NADH-quinone oxidoreductase subunit E